MSEPTDIRSGLARQRWVLIAYLAHLLVLALLALDIISAWKISPPELNRKLLLGGIVLWMLAASAALALARDRRRFLAWAVGPLLSVYTFGLCLVPAEILARVVWRQSRPGERRTLLRDPGKTVFEVDSSLVPGVWRNAGFTVNRLGFRGPEPPSRAGVYKIVTVGGSTTECWVLDDSTEWPHLLMQELNRAQAGHPVWVANAGISGHTTVQHLAALRSFAAFREADLLLFLTGYNDLAYAINARGAPTQEFLERQQDWLLKVPHPPDRPYLKRLALYRAASSAAVQLLLGGKNPYARYFSEFLVARRRLRASSPVVPLPDLTASVAEYHGRLVRLVEECRRMHKQCILLTQPAMWRADLGEAERNLLWGMWVGANEQPEGFVSPADAAQAITRFNRELLAVCAEKGLPCYDLAAIIPKDTTAFFDDCHFNENGARLVARAVGNFLLEREPWATRHAGR